MIFKGLFRIFERSIQITFTESFHQKNQYKLKLYKIKNITIVNFTLILIIKLHAIYIYIMFTLMLLIDVFNNFEY